MLLLVLLWCFFVGIVEVASRQLRLKGPVQEIHQLWVLVLHRFLRPRLDVVDVVAVVTAVAVAGRVVQRGLDKFRG